MYAAMLRHHRSCRPAPDQQPPADTGLIAVTLAEVTRLFILITRQQWPVEHHLCWVVWRRRRQARARWLRHRTRLHREATAT
jgi:hypothetical protein